MLSAKLVLNAVDIWELLEGPLLAEDRLLASFVEGPLTRKQTLRSTQLRHMTLTWK